MDTKIPKGLGYQAISLEIIKVPRSSLLCYSKEKVDKIIDRMKERILYLQALNNSRVRSLNIFRIYKNIMEENGVHSPYELEKHFEKCSKAKPSKVRL